MTPPSPHARTRAKRLARRGIEGHALSLALDRVACPKNRVPERIAGTLSAIEYIYKAE